ncbi:predicted protein [Postia placenta Mad-698-R]|nr:predicted protein [Postia placenta Mad-698-R]
MEEWLHPFMGCIVRVVESLDQTFQGGRQKWAGGHGSFAVQTNSSSHESLTDSNGRGSLEYPCNTIDIAAGRMEDRQAQLQASNAILNRHLDYSNRGFRAQSSVQIELCPAPMQGSTSSQVASVLYEAPLPAGDGPYSMLINSDRAITVEGYATGADQQFLPNGTWEQDRPDLAASCPRPDWPMCPVPSQHSQPYAGSSAYGIGLHEDTIHGESLYAGRYQYQPRLGDRVPSAFLPGLQIVGQIRNNTSYNNFPEGDAVSHGNVDQVSNTGFKYQAVTTIGHERSHAPIPGSLSTCPSATSKPRKGKQTKRKPEVSASCSVCYKVFDRAGDCNRHQRTTKCAGGARTRFSCSKCGRPFTRSDNLLMHMDKFHNFILMVNVELERARGYGQGRRSAHLNTNEAAGQAYDSGDAEITIAEQGEVEVEKEALDPAITSSDHSAVARAVSAFNEDVDTIIEWYYVYQDSF